MPDRALKQSRDQDIPQRPALPGRGIGIQPASSRGVGESKGHLEAVSSGMAIVNYVRQMLLAGKKSILNIEKKISAYDVALAARNGDDLAISAYDHAGFYLGQALGSFIHIFNPLDYVLIIPIISIKDTTITI